MYNNGEFFIWLKEKKKIVSTSPTSRNTRSKTNVKEDIFVRQLRSRGIIIQERRKFSKEGTSSGGMKMGGQQSKKSQVQSCTNPLIICQTWETKGRNL